MKLGFQWVHQWVHHHSSHKAWVLMVSPWGISAWWLNGCMFLLSLDPVLPSWRLECVLKALTHASFALSMSHSRLLFGRSIRLFNILNHIQLSGLRVLTSNIYFIPKVNMGFQWQLFHTRKLVNLPAFHSDPPMCTMCHQTLLMFERIGYCKVLITVDNERPWSDIMTTL